MIKKIQGLLRKKAPAILVYLQWINQHLRNNHSKLLSSDCIWCYKNITPLPIDGYKFQKILSHLDQKPVRFLQIGANDGKVNDPIYPYVTQSDRWSGVLVEPFQEAFELLQKNYSHRQGLEFEMSAISDETGTKPFYYLREDVKNHFPNRQNNYSGLNGFSKEHLLNAGGGIFVPFIEEQTIKTMTLQDLILKYAIDRLDLLVIDVEGYEYQVLKQMDLQQLRPRSIIFEYKNLSYFDCHRLIDKLIPYYTIYSTDFDILALDSDLDFESPL